MTSIIGAKVTKTKFEFCKNVFYMKFQGKESTKFEEFFW